MKGDEKMNTHSRIDLMSQSNIEKKLTKAAKSSARTEHVAIDSASIGPEVNLVPENLRSAGVVGLRKKAFGLITTYLMVVFALIAGYFAIDYVERQARAMITQYDFEIARVKNEIGLFSAEQADIRDLSKQVSAGGQLLSNHVQWSDFFTFLEQNTINDVFYEEMVIDENTVTLNIAAFGYEALARQILAFQRANDFVDDVQVRQVSIEESKDENFVSIVRTIATLTINENIVIAGNEE